MVEMRVHSRLRYYRLEFVCNVLDRCTSGWCRSQLDTGLDDICKREIRNTIKKRLGVCGT